MFGFFGKKKELKSRIAILEAELRQEKEQTDVYRKGYELEKAKVSKLECYKTDNLTLISKVGALQGALVSSDECVKNQSEKIAELNDLCVRYRADLAKLTERLKTKKSRSRKKKSC